MSGGARVVEQAYMSFIRDRDIDAVLAFFTEDAEWHPVTPHPTRESSIPVRAYWEDSGEFLDGAGSDWRVLDQHMNTAHSSRPTCGRVTARVSWCTGSWTAGSPTFGQSTQTGALRPECSDER